MCVRRMKQNSESDRRSPEGERRSPSSEDEREEKESSAEITNPDDYKEIFAPRSAICETHLPRHTYTYTYTYIYTRQN